MRVGDKSGVASVAQAVEEPEMVRCPQVETTSLASRDRVGEKVWTDRFIRFAEQMQGLIYKAPLKIVKREGVVEFSEQKGVYLSLRGKLHPLLPCVNPDRYITGNDIADVMERLEQIERELS
ncbi:MAG: hypothetical protein S4CHLAM102_11230 [Chlamydiia bacterium]|nr:hypothetical protein [Chlamydiia bacterium]